MIQQLLRLFEAQRYHLKYVYLPELLKRYNRTIPFYYDEIQATVVIVKDYSKIKWKNGLSIRPNQSTRSLTILKPPAIAKKVKSKLFSGI